MKCLLTAALIAYCLIARGQSLTFTYDAGASVDHLGTYIKDEQLGGISGIEYVPQARKWYLVTDGKGTARQSYVFEIDGSKEEGLPDWNRASAIASHPLANVAYAEAIRFDGSDLWVCTEENAENPNEPDLKEKGKIARIGQKTWAADTAALFYKSKSDNRGIEAICFSPDKKLVYIAEWPLPGDGLFARLNLLNYTDKSSKLVASYAYPLNPKTCLYPSQLANGTDGNGITDILPVAKDRFLILERCYNKEKAGGCEVKLFEIEINAGTTNLASRNAQPLENDIPFKPLVKKEVFNFNAIPNLKIDNLEAMAWGPDKKSLVIVSDNNYQKKTEIQKTQWIVLSVQGL